MCTRKNENSRWRCDKNKGVTMVLECDLKEKEERTKCLRENTCNDSLRIGKIALQCGKETLEKSVS